MKRLGRSNLETCGHICQTTCYMGSTDDMYPLEHARWSTHAGTVTPIPSLPYRHSITITPIP
eukprot:8107072-Pyramimonas_sp.AAC.1